ncbi:hypothetical protein B0H14DRAFT_2565006 [Mycena olivaceomarginata]|nr:hypothetical protein B0H14DRAFT_2565006 [Mycena olivaceomarginata]
MASEAIPINPVLLAEEAPPEAPRRHGDTVETPVLNGASTQIGDTALARETPAAALPPTSSSPPPDASTYPPRRGETRADYEPPLRLRLPGAQASQIGEFRKATFRARKVLTRKGHGVVSECILVRGEGVLDQKTRLLVCGGEFVDCGVCGRVDAVGGGGALDGRANVLRMGGAILEGRAGEGRRSGYDFAGAPGGGPRGGTWIGTKSHMLAIDKRPSYMQAGESESWSKETVNMGSRTFA